MHYRFVHFPFENKEQIRQYNKQLQELNGTLDNTSRELREKDDLVHELNAYALVFVFCHRQRK